jgi:hypothetical protein
MTTIVRHKRTGNEYILLGINGEENKTNPSRFINELFSQAKSEVSCSATVCDVQGNLFLAYIDDLIVIEIDGKKPADILPEPDFTESPHNDETYQSRERKVEAEFDDEEFDDEEFDDEEFDDEELEPESDRVIITPSKPPDFSQSKSDKNDLNEDEQDWI